MRFETTVDNREAIIGFRLRQHKQTFSVYWRERSPGGVKARKFVTTYRLDVKQREQGHMAFCFSKVSRTGIPMFRNAGFVSLAARLRDTPGKDSAEPGSRTRPQRFDC